MLRLYIIGIFILLIAIIANVFAEKIGLSTWYDFGNRLFNKGFVIFKEVGFFSVLWLFILYPFVLALGYLIGDYIMIYFDYE